MAMQKVFDSLFDFVGLLRSLMVTVPLIYVWTIIMGILSWLISPFDQDTHRQHACSRIWARGLLWIAGVKTIVRGKERLDFSRPYVFLSNHTSYMDIPTLFAHLPVTFRIMAKSSLFKIPFLGWHLERTGNMPIGRVGDVRAAARALLQAMRHIRNGGPMLVFPEGGRTPDGKLQEFRPGIFLAAIKTGTPIVPITIRGTGHALPSHSWHLRPGKIEVFLDAPIETEKLTKADLDTLIAQVRAAMQAHLNP